MLAILLLVLFSQQAPVLVSDNGTIAGTLRTADGKPAVGVRVTAMVPPGNNTEAAQASSMSSIVETDDNGRYRLEGVPPGRYVISAGNILKPTFFPGTLDVLKSQVITVSAKQNVVNIDFPLLSDSAGRAATLTSFSFGPVQTGLLVPVSITGEGGIKVPVFQKGIYPLLTLTERLTATRLELPLSVSTVMLPVPSANGTDYKVTVEGLQDGYAVQSMKYDGIDLLKNDLKATRQGFPAQWDPKLGIHVT